MKTIIISNQQHENNVIDFHKINLLKDGYGVVVLTDGAHRKESFSGMVICAHADFTVGHYSDSWNKRQFKLITEPITIQFNPE